MQVIISRTCLIFSYKYFNSSYNKWGSNIPAYIYIYMGLYMHDFCLSYFVSLSLLHTLSLISVYYKNENVIYKWKESLFLPFSLINWFQRDFAESKFSKPYSSQLRLKSMEAVNETNHYKRTHFHILQKCWTQ